MCSLAASDRLFLRGPSGAIRQTRHRPLLRGAMDVFHRTSPKTGTLRKNVHYNAESSYYMLYFQIHFPRRPALSVVFRGGQIEHPRLRRHAVKPQQLLHSDEGVALRLEGVHDLQRRVHRLRHGIVH